MRKLFVLLTMTVFLMVGWSNIAYTNDKVPESPTEAQLLQVLKAIGTKMTLLGMQQADIRTSLVKMGVPARVIELLAPLYICHQECKDPSEIADCIRFLVQTELKPAIDLTDMRYKNSELHFRINSMKNTIDYEAGKYISVTEVQCLISLGWTVNIKADSKR